ncbi:MAG: DUF4351 domain-containing protein [Acidobacteriota bacterium]
MLEDTVRGWTRQWLAEGKAEGERQGHVDLLERQLGWKFGPLPEDARRRLDQASDAQLLEWSRRLLTAGRLEDVWSEP